MATLSPPPALRGEQSATRPKAARGFVLWMMAANLGISMAFMVPLSYALAVRIDRIAPGHDEVLGYVTGTAQAVYIVLSPLVGVWSDRTRTRIGRRLPFLLGGAVLGLVALPAVALAPNVPLMGAAWVFALLGWTTAAQAILNLQADRIPEERRGKVSGLTGLTGQMGPIVGIGLVSAVSGHTLLVFMLPALVGAVLAAVFLRVGSRGESRTDTPVPAGPVSVRTLLAGYTFSPRQNPDFAWNWLGRLTFFTGLYFNTTFSTFFYAQRLRMTVQDVAGTVAVIGMLGILAAALGAVGGGMLSDRLGRRRLFALVGGLFFVAGAVTEAFSHSFPQLVVGSVLMQLSIAFFTAVDQAIVMAVLPSQEEAGRYMTVGVLSLKIPSALAPLIAPFILAVGASGGEKNYTLLYLTGAALAFLGGLMIFTRVKAVR